MLTIEVLNKVLESFGIKFEFSHFNGPVSPPFITYLIPSSDNFEADDSVYFSSNRFRIELYTRIKTLDEEYRLEQHFINNGIIWEKISQSWDDTDKVNVTVYEVS